MSQKVKLLQSNCSSEQNFCRRQKQTETNCHTTLAICFSKDLKNVAAMLLIQQTRHRRNEKPPCGIFQNLLFQNALHQNTLVVKSKSKKCTKQKRRLQRKQ